ncbi:MAG TPA: mechanosensitive ion channel family protein [Planctomycetota bacterium]|nr:mechanosensitive ion channel family protein [Planctomycetota bacterium]
MAEPTGEGLIERIPWREIVAAGLRIVLIVALAIVAYRVIKFVIDRFAARLADRTKDEELKKREATLAKVVSHLVLAVILVVTVITLLGQLGVEVGPVLAAVGVAGLAIGFGAQALVKDVITGFFILLENQAREGDVISAGGVAGVVESINLRMIVLRDLNGNVHYIPHSQIGVLTNMTKEYSRLVVDVGVAYKEDVDEVMQILKQVGDELAGDEQFKDNITGPYEIMGVEKFADSAVVIRTRITTKPIQQWGVARELRRRIKKTLDARNIEIPFPHITMYMGEPKQGEPAPMVVKLEKTQEGKTG